MSGQDEYDAARVGGVGATSVARPAVEPASGSGANSRPPLPVLLGSAQEQLPGLARIAAGAAWRSARWTAGATSRSGRLLVRTVSDPAGSAELLEEVARDVADAARVVSDVARRIGGGVAVGQAVLEGTSGIGSAFSGTVTAGLGAVAGENPPTSLETPPAEPDLRERGMRLLDRSRDVWSDEGTHPAFSRILDDLAPDEARILLLLVKGGPQPSVDVRSGGPIGSVSSKLIAPGLNMIGPRAGVRYLDRVPSYLNNLFRLGLIWLSRESLDDPQAYQVLEAQPDVLEAMHSVRFHKVVRRSINLTPFGADFCRACLLDPGETTGLPQQMHPSVADR